MKNHVVYFLLALTIALFIAACGTDTTNNGESDQGNTTDSGDSVGDTGSGSDTGNTAADTADTGNTGGDTGNTGGDTGNTGGDTGNTGGDTGNTGGDTGNTGGDTGNTGGDTGNTGGDTGNTGGDTGNTSADTANTGDSSDSGDSSSDTDEGEEPDDDSVDGQLVENPFIDTTEEPISTFAITGSTATYSRVRTAIKSEHIMPDPNEIRIEEMVNYFDFDYPEPTDGEPLALAMEMSPSPWKSGRDVVMIKLRTRAVDDDHNTRKNIVLLVDVSGSMRDNNKLPLIKQAFHQLVEQLNENDSVAIVSYTSTAELVLPSTPGDKKTDINYAINSLEAHGSTNASAGLSMAYEQAEKAFIEGGTNRVILASDGDFNVGITNHKELLSFISEKRKKHIFLTVLGFGYTNYKDNTMQVLADHGDGNYYYIDTKEEAYRVFVQKMQSTLFTLIKDTKIQVEFNPQVVKRYRLIGYETRKMNNSDFNDDGKDGGELSADTTVAAFYEIERDENAETPPDTVVVRGDTSFNPYDVLELRVRYKNPGEDFSRYISTRLENSLSDPVSQDMSFATAVVEYSMLLRKSKFRESSSYDDVIQRASAAIGTDTWGLRAEFVDIVELTKNIDQ